MNNNNSEIVSLWKENILSKVYQSTENSGYSDDQDSDLEETHFTKYFGNSNLDNFTFSEELTVSHDGNVSGIE